MKKIALFIALSLMFTSKNALALTATVNDGLACSSKEALSNATMYIERRDYAGLVRSGCIVINGTVYVKDYGFISSAIEYNGRTYYIPNEFLSLNR